MADAIGRVIVVHPVPGNDAALGVADEDDLLRAGDRLDCVDIGANLVSGRADGPGCACTIVGREDGPAVLA